MRRGAWDVLILDLSGLGEGGGAQVLDELKLRRPRLPVLVYSMHPEAHYGPLMLRAGAQAYLAKGRTTAVLREAIRALAAGRRYITPTLADLLLEPRSSLALSARETQIVACLVAGKTSSEIALALGVSASTVSTHLRHIREKTGARSSGET